MYKPSYYGVFGLFVSILILVFLIWDNEYSRVVIMCGAILIIVVSVLEILLGINISEIPLDNEKSNFFEGDSRKNSLKFINEIESQDKKNKREVI